MASGSVPNTPSSELTLHSGIQVNESPQRPTSNTVTSTVEQEQLDEDAIFAHLETGPAGRDFNVQAVSEAIKDDESAVTRRRVQLAQAVMHVGPVDPNWKVSGHSIN